MSIYFQIVTGRFVLGILSACHQR